MRLALQNIKRKLAETKGDTLVESLAALLIAVLAATLLATMVISAVNVTATSKQAMEKVYQAENLSQDIYGTTVSIKVGSVTEHLKANLYVSKDDEGKVVFRRYENTAWREDGA